MWSMLSAGMGQSSTTPRTWTTNMPVGLSNKRICGPGTDPSAPPSLPGPSRACSPLNAAPVLSELSSNWMVCSGCRENTARPGNIRSNFDLDLKSKTRTAVDEVLVRASSKWFAIWLTRFNQTAAKLVAVHRTSHQSLCAARSWADAHCGKVL